MKRKFAKTASVLLVSLMTFAMMGSHIVPAHAWWETGHMIVASHAARLLPRPWSSFFEYYGFLVNETSTYPDMVKDLDPNEDPRHFIDLEIWNPKKPETGTLPSAVEQYTGEMSQAIKSGDWNRAFVGAGRVAHYVADICQPYHSTVNYNPANKAGTALHGVLDASIETHVNEFKLAGASDVSKLQPVENVTAFMFYIARQSSSFLYTINRTLINEGKTWSPELTTIIENRTNTAIISVARVWYTAIERAQMQPPTIPTPNRLSIAIETKTQQASPYDSFSVVFTVSDSLGVHAVLQPRVTAGDLQVSVYPAFTLAAPFRNYVAVIPPDILARYAGSSLILNLVAERAGFESASTQLQIQVSQTQTVTPQPPSQADTSVVIVLVVTVAVVVTGLVLVARRRSAKARKEEL